MSETSQLKSPVREVVLENGCHSRKASFFGFLPMLRPFQALRSFIVGAIAIAASCTTAQAAERISFQFGILGDSLAVESLKAFAEDGTVDAELAAFLNFLPLQVQTQLREGLTQTMESSETLPASQWLYSPVGDKVLDYAGSIIKMPSGQSGKVALRAAIVLAGGEPGGATPMGVLEAFPAESIRLDLAQAWGDWRRIRAAWDADATVVAQVKQAALVEAERSPVDPEALPPLSKLGPWTVHSQSWMLEDPDRERRYPVDIYQPRDLGGVTGPVPLVVMSHGYAVDRKYFVGLATHLASYGVVVAVPEHVGSNLGQRLALEAGLSQESFLPSEFVDRPLDITAVLDELERRNGADYQGRLQLDRVALVGHSMGGYTALVTSGATVNFDHLQGRCLSRFIEVDTALLLACRALELPGAMARSLQDGSLRDERVQLVVGLSPVASLFGEEGMGKITIPTVMLAGNYDLAAPIVPEQVEPFGWLKNAPEQSLYVVENWSHEEGITKVIWDFLGLEGLLGQSFEEANLIFQANLGAALVAAVDVYLRGEAESREYLSSGYVEAVSAGDLLRMHLVRSPVP